MGGPDFHFGSMVRDGKKGIRALLGLGLAAILTVVMVPVKASAQSNVRYTVVVNNQAPAVTYTIQGVYWPTNSEFFSQPGGGVLETWNSQLYGIDFRVDTRSHWGIHLNGVTGSQSNWGFGGAAPVGLSLSGTDTIWTADVSYLVQQPLPENPLQLVTFRAFLGYGDAKGNLFSSNLSGLGPASLTADSTGFRVGFDFSYPFAASAWSLNAGVAYAPSMTTTISGTANAMTQTASAGGTGWDGQASVRYTAPGHWNVEVGYRYVREEQGALNMFSAAVCPCHTLRQGPFVAAGVSF